MDKSTNIESQGPNSLGNYFLHSVGCIVLILSGYVLGKGLDLLSAYLKYYEPIVLRDAVHGLILGSLYLLLSIFFLKNRKANMYRIVLAFFGAIYFGSTISDWTFEMIGLTVREVMTGYAFSGLLIAGIFYDSSYMKTSGLLSLAAMLSFLTFGAKLSYESSVYHEHMSKQPARTECNPCIMQAIRAVE